MEYGNVKPLNWMEVGNRKIGFCFTDATFIMCTCTQVHAVQHYIIRRGQHILNICMKMDMF